MAAAERKERYGSIKAKMVSGEQVSQADAQFVTLYEGMMAVADQVAADRAAEKAAALAEMNARTPEEIERTNRAIDFEAQSLDRVGLNIAGEAVETEPAMKPLTEDDKNVLDFVASTGASVQALAEIERDLRTSAIKFGPAEQKIVIKSNVTANREMRSDIEDVISKIRNGVNVSDVLTSVFFKPTMRPALEIVERWTFNHAYIDEQAIPELEALLK